MIDLLFYYGTEIVFVRIKGYNLTFSTTLQPNFFGTIDNLKLDRKGTIKEFPDLEFRPEWRQIAIQRLKDHLESLPNEETVCDYVIQELRKKGYLPKYKQKAGFRRETIK